MEEAGRLRPTALSASLNRRSVSTAAMTLRKSDGQPPFLSFVELYLRRGSIGLFRVTGEKREAGEDSCSYDLSHAICTLHDSVWREQADFEGTVAQFLTRLLSWQTTARWQLGQCQDPGQWKKSGINYDHLDDLLWELAADRADYLFAFDFSTTPWTLHFVAASGSVDC